MSNRHSLPRAIGERYGAVAGDRKTVHGKEDVANLDLLHGRQGLRHEDAQFLLVFGARLQPRMPAQPGRLQPLEVHPYGGEARVAPVAFNVLKQVAEDLRGDDVSAVLHVRVDERLEGNSHDSVGVIYDRPAAVAGIDGRVDLDGQQICSGLRIRLHLNPANDASCDAHGVAAHRVADHLHVVIQGRHLAKFHARHSFPKLVLQHGQDGQVAFRRFRHHLCHEFLAPFSPAHLHQGAVLYCVRVGDDAPAFDAEARRSGGNLPLSLPRLQHIWKAVAAEDAHRGVLHSLQWDHPLQLRLAASGPRKEAVAKAAIFKHLRCVGVCRGRTGKRRSAAAVERAKCAKGLMGTQEQTKQQPWGKKSAQSAHREFEVRRSGGLLKRLSLSATLFSRQKRTSTLGTEPAQFSFLSSITIQNYRYCL
eukprot:scaffold4700_cov271-Pinguiococcus_pyrenoidosus.AAC.2